MSVYRIKFSQVNQSEENMYLAKENKNELAKHASSKLNKEKNTQMQLRESKSRASKKKPLHFIPSKKLLEAANVFSENLKAIEENIDNYRSTPVDIKQCVRDHSQETDLDDSNKILIDLFETLTNILKKSEDEKKEKNKNAFESGAAIASLILKANKILSELLNTHSKLWSFVLFWQQGRDAMYFLSAIVIDHVEVPEKYNTDWRAAFLKDTTHPQETDFLQHVDLLIKLKSTPTESARTVGALIKNNAIHHAYDVFEQYDEPDIKIKKLLELAKTKFVNISGRIPKRIVRRVIDAYAFALMMDITTFSSNYKGILLAIIKLVNKNYLPEFLKAAQSISGSSELQVFMTVYQYYNYIKIVRSNHTISKQFAVNELHDQIKTIILMCVSNYSMLTLTNEFDLSDAILNDLISAATRLIRSNYLNDLAPNIDMYFWPALVKLHTKLNPKTACQDLQKHIDHLFKTYQYDKIRALLECIIGTHQDNAQYQALKSVLHFIIRLPEQSNFEDDFGRKTINLGLIVLLNEVAQEKYDFSGLTPEFLSHFKHVKGMLQFSLNEKLKHLQSTLSSFMASDNERLSILKMRDGLLKLVMLLEIDTEIISTMFLRFSNENETIPSLSTNSVSEQKSSSCGIVDAPDTSLEIDKHVLNCFKLMEARVENINSTESYFPVYNPSTIVPKEFEPLVNFYLNTINLIKLSHDVTKERENISKGKENISTLVMSTSVIYEQLINLKKDHLLLWETKILCTLAGRHILYLLLLNFAFLRDVDLEIPRSLITALMSNASCLEEVEILEYFDFIVLKLHGTLLELTESRLKNRLIAFHVLFTSDIKEVQSIKITKLKEIIKSTFIFSDTIPGFIPSALRILNAQLFFNEIDPKDQAATVEYVAIIPKCCESKYFPSIPLGIENTKTSSVISLHYNLEIHMESYFNQYVFQAFNLNNALYGIYITLQYQTISIFKYVLELDWINNDIIKVYSDSACALIIKNALDNLSSEHIKDFCESIVKMLSFMKPMQDFVSETNTVFTSLFTQGKKSEAKFILYYFISQLEFWQNNHLKINKDMPDIGKYKALLSAVQLYTDLLEISNITKTDEIKKSVSNICVITDDIKLLTLSFLNSKFPNFLVYFKKEFIRHLKEIENKIGFLNSSTDEKESLKSFQNSIIQLAKLLCVSDAELIEIKKNIHYDSDDVFSKTLEDPLFDSEVKQKSARKKQLQKNPAKSGTAASEMKEELPCYVAEMASDSDDFDLAQISKNTKKPISKPKVKPPVKIKSQSVTKIQQSQGQPVPSKFPHSNTTKAITSTLASISTSKFIPKSNYENKITEQKSKVLPQPKQPVPQNKAAMSTPTPTTFANMIKFVRKKPDKHPAASRVVANNETTTTDKSTQIVIPAPIDIVAPTNIALPIEVSSINTQSIIQPLTPITIEPPIETLSPITTNTDPSTPIDTMSDTETGILLDTSTATDTATEQTPNAAIETAAITVAQPSLSTDTTLETKLEVTRDDYSTSHQTPLSSLTIFKTDPVDPNLIVSREQFHTKFLNFLTVLHNHTYLVTKKHLYIIGGVIPYLHDKEDNDGDLDVVVFCQMSLFFPFLDEEHYDYEIMGHYQILHVRLPLQECELLSVKSAPTLDNLAALPIMTNAAYVRAPDGLYYINRLKNICEKIPLTPEKLVKFDRKLKPVENSIVLSDDELNRIKLVIKPHRVHVRAIEIDITCCDTLLNELDAIRENLRHKDITPSGGCIRFTPETTHYVIQGTEDVLYSLKKGIISPINCETIFFEDPIQLFRVVKEKLKHKRYERDKMLKNFIEINDGQYVVDLFNSFIFNNKNPSMNVRHLRQIGTKLDDIFSRFDTHSVIEELLESNIIKGLTGMHDNDTILEMTDILDAYLDTLPKDSKKMGFYHFLYAISYLSNQDFNVLDLLERSLFTDEEKQTFNHHIQFIDRTIMARMLPRNIQSKNEPSVEFINFIKGIKLHFANKAVEALSAQSVCTTPTLSYGR